MKQIVEQLNKIAKKIDANVDIPDSDLIIDSLDAITKAYGGTPNNSNLIVDKLEDIAGVVSKGGGGSDEPTEIVYIPEQTVTLTSAGEGVPFNTGLLVDVTLDPENPLDTLPVVINGDEYILTYTETMDSAGYGIQNPPLMIMYNPSDQSWVVATTISGEITISSVVNVGPEHDIPTMDITFVNANMASSIDVPAKKRGYYIAGISVPPQQEATVKALISRAFDEEDGYIYMVALHSEATFRNDNNTGENCTIDMPPDDATRLYIYITDINQPASAIIHLLGGTV